MSKYWANIRKQYLITFFQALIPAYVIERLFWSNRGMTIQMVVYIEIIYAVTVLALEVPSGILADRLGRKKLLVVSAVLNFLEFFILLFARSFLMFGLAVFAAGIEKALYSGTNNALIYDSLLAIKKESDFEKIRGRAEAVDMCGSIIAALSGSLLAVFFALEVNYIISLFSAGAAFIITVTLIEPPMITEIESGLMTARQYAKEAVSFFKNHKMVLLYCTTGAFVGACLTFADEFWQIILQDVGVPVAFFGAAGAAILLLRIPGSLVAYKIKEKLSYPKIFAGIIVVNCFGLFTIYLTGNYFVIIPILFVSLASGVLDPILAGYIHHRIDSGMRATIESMSSLALRLATILAGLIFGYVANKLNVFAGFLSLAVVMLIYIAFFTVFSMVLRNRE